MATTWAGATRNLAGALAMPPCACRAAARQSASRSAIRGLRIVQLLGPAEAGHYDDGCSVLWHRLRRIASASREPVVTRRVETSVIGIEIDEAALNQEVADLEDIAPASRMRHTGAPRPVLVFTGARTLDGEDVRAGHDPVERGVVVQDRFDPAAEIREELPDLLLAGRQPPLREEHLRIVGKEVENTAAGGRHPLVVEGFQVLQCHRLALLVGHRLSRDRHVAL